MSVKLVNKTPSHSLKMYNSTLNKFQKNRYNSLKESFKETILNILEDEMLNKLLKGLKKKKYWKLSLDRIEEIVNYNLTHQREIYVEKLISQYSFLKNEFFKSKTFVNEQRLKIMNINKTISIYKKEQKQNELIKQENLDLKAKLEEMEKKHHFEFNKIKKDFKEKNEQLNNCNLKLNDFIVNQKAEMEKMLQTIHSRDHLKIQFQEKKVF